MSDTALCRICGEIKSRSLFWAADLKFRKPRCIACSKKASAEWRAKNREKTRERMMAWHAANPDKSLEYSLKARYGITVEQYRSLLDEQGGLCACCGKPGTGGPGPLLVDHNHHTGEIRGLVCRPCNTGIGMLGDDIDGARRALSYLERATMSGRSRLLVDKRHRRRGRVSKLTPDLLQEIRGRFEHGEPKRSIGRRLGIDPSIVRLVVTGER